MAKLKSKFYKQFKLKMDMNKRGQELSTGTIILIVLGVIVLVVLVIGFSIGWSKIVPFVNQNNVNTISTQCLSACSQGTVYDFCARQFELDTGTTSLKNVTCNYLSQPGQQQYGISACPTLPCSNVVILSGVITPADLQSGCSSNTGKIVEGIDKTNTLLTKDC